MSKAFTKEDDGDDNAHVDELLQSPHPNLVTPSGLAALNARLKAKQSDLAGLRERPADMGTPHDIAIAERDIRFLKGRINRAILVDPKDHSPDVVAFGAEVDVVTEDDDRLTFRIVGEDEADPALGLISPYSPIGAALIGTHLGNSTVWPKPGGSVELEIVAIRFR